MVIGVMMIAEAVCEILMIQAEYVLQGGDVRALWDLLGQRRKKEICSICLSV